MAECSESSLNGALHGHRPCSAPPRAYIHTSELNEHIAPLSDTRRRPHVCSTCKRAFLRSEHLKRHVLAHEKKKPFTCTACGVSYGRNDVLQRHRRRCPQRMRHSSTPASGICDSPRHLECPAQPSRRQEPRPQDTLQATRWTTPPPEAALDVNGILGGESVVETSVHRDELQSSDPHQKENIFDSSRGPGTPCYSPQDLARQHIEQMHNAPVSNANHYESHVTGPTQASARDPFMEAQIPRQAAAQVHSLQGTHADTSKQTDSHDDQPSSVLSPTGDVAESTSDFANFGFEEEIFLEDSLLFQFNYNHSGLTIPSTPNPYSGGNVHDHRSAIQLPTPESAPSFSHDISVYTTLHVSANDLQTFYESLGDADLGGDLESFRRPSLSRTFRCLVAYFQHFDPHTPLVHFSSFSISDSHPSLVLIMLAIGAVHLSEHGFAESAYEASSLLLAQHDKKSIQHHAGVFDLWHAQASVLCSQYAAFAGEQHHFRRAQQHLFSAQTVMHQGLAEIRAKWQAPMKDWSTWIFLETCSRVISWLFVLSGMILAFDPFAVAIVPPMPCPLPSPSDESVWHAVSEAEWRIAHRADSSNRSVDLWTLAKSVILGEAPENSTRISAFTLLTLIGAILTNICTRRRLSIDVCDPLSPDYVCEMERALAVWEGLWRRHPRAEQSVTRLDDPLLNDCLSLFGSAHYHLYLGEELYTLKKIAETPSLRMQMPPCRNRSRAHKVVKYAANSWLVRAKLGVTYLNKAGGLQLGSQALVTAYESALLLAWWLYIQQKPDLQPPGQTFNSEDQAGAASVQRVFDDILGELDEQGIHYDQTGNPVLSPIDFYIALLDRWVWKSSTVIERRLRGIASIFKE